MELRDLHYFETIADTGNLGRAAKEVCRSGPALTKSIHRLEQALGVRLFERVGRSLRLTQEGHALLLRARHLRQVADEAVREMGDLSSGLAGCVRLGVVPTMAQYLLPAACRLLLAEVPSVTLETTIGMSPMLYQSLRAREIDLAVAVVPPANSEFDSYPIIEDDVVVVAGSSHEIFRKRAKMQDLTAYRWVLPAAAYETEVRVWLERAFDRAGLARPTVQIQTNSITLLPRLIAETGLLSFVSRRNLGRGRVGAPLKELRLKETTMRRQFGVVHRKDAYLSPAAIRLKTLLCAKGKKLFLGKEAHPSAAGAV
jgi:DNA-binding transcriptional LysR family regulator